MRCLRLISKNLLLQQLDHNQENTNGRRGSINSNINPVFSWDPYKVILHSNIAARPTNMTNKNYVQSEGGGLTPSLFPILTEAGDLQDKNNKN